jgi:stage II sporulation protein D
VSSKYLWHVLLSIILSLLVVFPAAAAQTTRAGLVRVKLVDQADSLGFTVSGNYELVDQSTGKLIVKLKPGEKWLVKIQDGRIALVGEGGRNGVYKGPVRVQAQNFQASILTAGGVQIGKYGAGDLYVINSEGSVLPLEQPQAGITFKGSKGVVSLGDSESLNLVSLTSNTGVTRYRGDFEFVVDNGKLTAINELDIEEYLYGVVPSEAIPSWPEEALKAQAVAARNYAMQKVETSRGEPFNMVADQYNQVYGGYDAETEATNKAVKDTSGIVMVSKGSLITAFFHSSSGGFTENSEDVWLNPLPYIKWKADPFDKNDNHYNWQVTYTSEQLTALMTKAGYPLKTVTGIEIKERTSSGARVKTMEVTGVDDKEKTKRIKIGNADQVRATLGLKSALFVMEVSYNEDKSLKSVKITGRGYGHGVGMSQYGACGMASQGYNYQDILKYYYSGVTITGGYGRSSSLR